MTHEDLERARLETRTAEPGQSSPAEQTILVSDPERPRTATAVQARPGGAGGGGRRSAYATRDLTEGSIPRNLWFLAWPQIIEGVLNVADQMVDLFWAGRGFGSRAIAGIGVAQNYTQFIMTGRQGLDTGMQAMVSRAIGAGNIGLANHITLQALTLSGAYSLTMVLLGVFFTEDLLRLLGVSNEVIAQGSLYMRVQFLGAAGIAFRMMAGSALQASGDTMTPMKATAATRILHIVLSPLLAFGWLGFPTLGLAGLAAANVLAQLVGAGMNFRALFTGTSRLHLTLRGYRLDFAIIWRQVRIGAPASVTGMERPLAQLVLVGFLAPFGDYALASYALANRAQMFVNLGMWGLGRSSGVLVGQNLGAGKTARARETILWAIGFMGMVNGILVSLVFFFPGAFLSIFNQEPELLSIAIPWLRIQVIGYLFMGASQIFMQSFNTAGDTVVPMFVTVGTIWGVQQPLAYFFSRYTTLGEFGIAWAIVIAMLAPLFVYIPYYIWGPWWRKRVLS
jgi:putative MATE family efflux protein